jgi:hypothetical protein
MVQRVTQVKMVLPEHKVPPELLVSKVQSDLPVRPGPKDFKVLRV